MNYLKLFFTSLSVLILFLIVKPAVSETVSNSPVSCYSAVSGNYHVEYIYIDDRLYEVTYSEDGRVLQLDPVE